jgi:putative membrane protein
MKRETQNVLLLLLGLGVGVMVVKGAYLHYVKPWLLPWLVIAAGGLVVLALACIVRDVRNGGTGIHAEIQEGHRHSGSMAWLLLVPVVLIAFVIPPPIGANGATPVAAASRPHPRGFPPLPAGRAPAVPVPEVVMRAATDSAGSLKDRLVTITGFTMKDDGGVYLARVVIVCCAADAQLAKLHLSGSGAAIADGYPEDTWLRIEATLVPGSATAATRFVPTMTVTEVTKVDKPANTYAY